MNIKEKLLLAEDRRDKWIAGVYNYPYIPQDELEFDVDYDEWFIDYLKKLEKRIERNSYPPLPKHLIKTVVNTHHERIKNL